VAEREGVVIGYAYGSAHRAREAYAKSVETSAYVDEVFQHGGVASALYTRLFDELSRLNYRSAFAGITVPNDANAGFHAHLGFRHIGVFPHVGYKLGDWHDVAWMYRPIQTPAGIPA
jgi:L-amino acid N-acyltransferase YncA